MKRGPIAVCVLAMGLWLLAPVAGSAAEGAAQKAAEEAAKSWLALVDSGNYGESWNQASQLFKQQVTAAQWESAVKAARGPLGKLQSRRVQSANTRRRCPARPMASTS